MHSLWYTHVNVEGRPFDRGMTECPGSYGPGGKVDLNQKTAPFQGDAEEGE